MSDRKRGTVVCVVLGFLGGVVITLGTALAIMFGAGSRPVVISGDTYDYYKKLDDRYAKLDTVYEKVLENYYEEPDEDAMQEMMYKGLIAGLGDPYSAYMTKEEYASYMDSVSGEFEGIGIVFSEDKNGRFVIIKVIPDSPADKAGLKSGDILLKADGKKYDTMEEVSAAIKGKAGTKVTVTYMRNEKENDVEIERDKIIDVTVQSKIMDGNIGYIEISGFEGHTGKDFQKALDELESKHVSGLIIDLRDNGGGMVTSCIEVTDLLMGKATIVSMEDRAGHTEKYSSDKETTSLPYVVLVNENSASAAEIMAAAIKDNTDNPIVGTNTFGKGIVQMTESLSDGSALKLTIMQYFSPNGTVIHKKGVKPDYVVENNDDTDAQLKRAIELLK